MKPGNPGAYGEALTKKRSPRQMHGTPTLYQQTPSSDSSISSHPIPSSIPTPHSTSSSSTITPLPRPRSSKLVIKWETDSESGSLSTSTPIPPQLTRTPPHSITRGIPQPPLKQATLARFFTPASQQNPSRPPPAPSAPPPHHHTTSTTSVTPGLSTNHHRMTTNTSTPPPPWVHRRKSRQRGPTFIIPPPHTPPPPSPPQSPPSPPPQLTTPAPAAPPAQAPLPVSINNPYVKLRDRIINNIPPPLAQLQISSQSSPSTQGPSTDRSQTTSDFESMSSVTTVSQHRLRRSQRLAPKAPPSSQPTEASDNESLAEILQYLTQDLDEISALTEQLTQQSESMSEDIQLIATQNTSLRNMVENISHMSTSSNLDIRSLQTPRPYDDASREDRTLDLETQSITSDITPHPDHANTEPAALPKTSPVLETITINNLGSTLLKEINNTLVDTLNDKIPGDFRIILQNPNGIRVYHDNDPEYLPSIESFKKAEADMFCLPETNVPWHKTDLLYNISKQNQITWQHLPVKTVAASCRQDKHILANYQPGGCLTTVTNTMTTKIKNATSDYLGRWTKINFFASKGTVAIYTVYRPNPSSLRQAGGDTVWMQQQRILEQEKDKEEPRKQLIIDLMKDITKTILLKS